MGNVGVGIKNTVIGGLMMRGDIAFLIDNRCNKTAAGMVVGWVGNNDAIDFSISKVVYANVHRWFRDRVYPIQWMTKKEIVGVSKSLDTALMASIEHVMQLFVAPWDQLEKAVQGEVIGFTGEWCSLCYHKPVPQRDYKCCLEPGCYGDCCVEWQTAYRSFDWIMKNAYNHSKLIEFKTNVKALLGKVIRVQLGDPSALVLVSDCWEDVYKMRTSAYVSSILNEELYVCGVSLSETDKVLTEMPNFTLHAPGPDLKGSLVYDLSEAVRET